MKVIVETGWKSRKTTVLDVSFHSNGCISCECTANINLNPMVGEMNDTLYDSYIQVGLDMGFRSPELDVRDNRTVWVWDRKQRKGVV